MSTWHLVNSLAHLCLAPVWPLDFRSNCLDHVVEQLCSGVLTDWLRTGPAYVDLTGPVGLVLEHWVFLYGQNGCHKTPSDLVA